MLVLSLRVKRGLMTEDKKVKSKPPKSVKPYLASTTKKNLGYRHKEPMSLVLPFKMYIPPRMGA